jgi:hypothetical protein
MLTNKFAVFSTEAGDHLERYAIFTLNLITNNINQIRPSGVLQLCAVEPDFEPIPVKIYTASGIVSTYYWKTGFDIVDDIEIIPVYDFINKPYVIPDGPRVSCHGDYKDWCELRMREQIQNHRLMLSITGCTEAVIDKPFVAKEKGLPTFVAAALKKAGIDAGAECMISMMPLKDCTKVSVTNCYHCFDSESLSEWFKTKNVCPLCKADITSVVLV